MSIRGSIFILLAVLNPRASSSVVDDDVLFQLNWPGSEIVLPDSSNVLLMTTAEDEQYQCLLPDEGPSGTDDLIQYAGPSAMTLINTLLGRSICTVRIETYWNYELCHGIHVRQYHESKLQGTNTKLLEYFLGRGYMYPTDPKFEIQNATFLSDVRENLKVPTFFLEDREYPYFEVIMGNGTPCDLKEGVPRLTRVHYICDQGGRNEILMQEESSTCEYRVVIATAILCSHPLYKIRDAPINTISCHPLNGSPSKPDGLRQLENSSPRRVKVTEMPATPQSTPQSPPVTTSVPPRDTVVLQTSHPHPPPHIDDADLAEQFLRGEHCLTGGKGWWKYEFCYKKYAKQYHIDKDGRTDVLLGFWNEADHKKWWTASKKTHTIGAKTITHFYGAGQRCDLTGQPRQVQVKLKCKDNVSRSAVSLYLIEPSVCNYILGVESSLLCPMFLDADEFGLF